MKSKNLLTILILGILIVGSFSNCKRSVTKKALTYGDNLKDAIENFENTRQDFAKEVTESVDNTSEDLSEENPDLPKVATDWESQWNSIQRRFKTLEEEFSDVGTKSEEYFTQLEELSSGITDEKIKSSELRKNKELKEKWTEAYIEATENIQKIRDVLREGNDFHRVLVASSIRQKIAENIIELQSISARAKTLMTELEQFTIEGKKLIS
ncbi:MAG: hypothetical protein JXL97_14715 [Bacteroidales bacterium]|nr:hypothetical protein [Bacteroidales bacterium]